MDGVKIYMLMSFWQIDYICKLIYMKLIRFRSMDNQFINQKLINRYNN